MSSVHSFSCYLLHCILQAVVPSLLGTGSMSEGGTDPEEAWTSASKHLRGLFKPNEGQKAIVSPCCLGIASDMAKLTH
jgi:hypothetical protein